MICGEPVWRKSKGQAGLPKSRTIMEPCGREAHVVLRGVVRRKDGSIYLRPWRPMCRHHYKPNDGWEAWVRADNPGIGERELVRAL